MSRILGAGLTVVAPVAALTPARAAAQTAAGLSGPPSEWRLELSAGGTWYENARFRSVDQTSSWSTNGQLSLSTTQRFRTGAFTLGGSAGRLYYPEIKDLGQWTYGGLANLSLASSRSTRLSLSQTYIRSNTRQLPSLDAEGLPVPTTGLDTATSTLSLTHRLSRRTQLEIEGAFTWRRYDNVALVGGERLDSIAALARHVGRDGAIVLTYGYSPSWYGERRERAHTAMLGFRRKPPEGVSFELGGGAAYLESVGEYYPAGRAELGVNGRKASISLMYFRDFGLAFGYGRSTIADRVSAQLSWAPDEKLRFHAEYSYGYRRDPADDGFRVRSHVATGGFDVGITEGLRLAARYSWEQNRTSGFEEVKGGRATASLSYGVDWR